MITFHDGPAAGQGLTLARAPLFLRVTHGPTGWDGLDQFSDKPRADERIHVYRRVTKPVMVHILRRPKGSGWYAMAEYRYVQDQPEELTMRRTERWQQWCLAQRPERNHQHEPEDDNVPMRPQGPDEA